MPASSIEIARYFLVRDFFVRDFFVRDTARYVNV
jgi:hypothetical protein